MASFRRYQRPTRTAPRRRLLPAAGTFADGFVVSLGVFGAVAAGLAQRGDGLATFEIVLAGIGMIAAYLARWRVGRVIAAASPLVFLFLEGRNGNVNRTRYWSEMVLAAGIFAATFAAAYLRMTIESRDDDLDRAVNEVQRKRADERLSEKLSGARNLSALEIEVERSRRHNHHVSVLFLRPDRVDEIDRVHGQLAVGRMLEQLAEAIGRSLRATDVPLPEPPHEFAIILPETDVVAARVVAERIRLAAAGRHLAFGVEELEMTVSIGVAAFPADATTNEDLVERSRLALDAAIELGGNRTVLYAPPEDAPPGWGIPHRLVGGAALR